MKRYSIFFMCLLIFGCDETSTSNDPTSKVLSDNNENNVTQEKANASDKVVSKTNYVPFPSGYGYMENLEQLQAATNENNRKVIRSHAWSLWAGIMQPVEELDWPLWYTWPNTTNAFEITNAEALAIEGKESVAAFGESIKKKSHRNMVKVNTDGPTYITPPQVIDAYPKDASTNSINDGTHFAFNGDIMIATESLSKDAMAEIRDKSLYQWSTLDGLHANKKTVDFNPEYIVTKHMYWPVKANGITAVPIWKNKINGKKVEDSYPGYVGYEIWDTLVGVDPSGATAGQHADVEFLYCVINHDNCDENKPEVKANAAVYGLDQFYHHKITQEDWDSFDDADKAILNAASYWANNQAIGVGDYLITIAMHINTKELPGWTLQSVWWTDEPDTGKYSTDRPDLKQATGPWKNYLLTDDYAVPPNAKGELDIAVNPYIEGVTHPIATSCRNCHARAGWPTGKSTGKPKGVPSATKPITSSYQNSNCPGLLDYLTKESECLKGITLTDFSWIIPDRANDDRVSK